MPRSPLPNFARLVLAALATLALLPAAHPAQGQTVVLRDVEKRLLTEKLDEFEVAHQAELRATAKLARVTKELHDALENTEIPVEQLRSIEGQLSLARSEAMTRSAEATRLRLDIYDRMERLAAFEELVQGTGASSWGTWTLDFGNDSGTMQLTAEGGRLQGSYQLAGGDRGVIRGSVQRDGRVVLERHDADAGWDRTLDGRISNDRREMQGTWFATELADGTRTSGVWVARRSDG